MEHIADTMPEARYQKVNRKAPAARPTPAPRITAVTIEAPAQPVAAAKPKPKSKEKPGASIVTWWPVAVAIFLCGYVTEWHQDAIQMGIWAERLLFPLTLLAGRRELGISEHMATILPNYALFLQLPLEGLLTKFTLDRGKGLQSAMMQLVALHGLCAFVLWLLNYLH